MTLAAPKRNLRIAVWIVSSMASVVAGVQVDQPWRLEAPRREVKEHVCGFLWIEAENFASYGGWLLDTQFAHKMGSGYLLAAGVGKPVAPAETTFAVPRAGTWHVWARTKDWVPAHHPGTFAVTVGGKGGDRTLGASGRDWSWEKVGAFDLQAGLCRITLEDRSGLYARCDAVLLCEDSAYRPPDGGEALAAERARLCGEPPDIEDCGAFDVVVVGGGPAGAVAAIAAARHGARTVLLHDRPVLGGNVSSELGVLPNGSSGFPGYREGGIIEETLLRSAHFAKGGYLSLSRAFAAEVAAETNLVAVLNARVVKVEMKGGTIAAAIARDPLTGARTRWRGRMFIDCTGDGWLGWFAGAKFRFGREARAEFDEEPAPDAADRTTMSGCLLGGYGVPRFRKVAKAAPWRTPPWADVLPPGFTRKAQGLNFKWWLEHPGDLDDCADPELARDELVRIFFAYWGWLRNDCTDPQVRELVQTHELAAIPYMNGRREGMRLVGDVVYTANDALTGRLFEDRIGHTGWPLDTHDPLGVQNPKGNGFWRSHPRLPAPAPIPYRILYSVNVPNLFMAGRCVSCTHVALGTLRVIATCAVMGQAAGTAAARCAAIGIGPREYGRTHIAELQRLLQKDDQFIPELPCSDPANLAIRAKATATSTKNGCPAERVNDCRTRTLKGGGHREWVSAPGETLPQAVRLDFPEPVRLNEVRIVFNSDFYLKRKYIRHEIPATLVRAYSLEVSQDGVVWRKVADDADNFLRLRVHRFPAQEVRALRVTVTATHGDPSARIFEIQAYGPKGDEQCQSTQPSTR